MTGAGTPAAAAVADMQRRSARIDALAGVRVAELSRRVAGAYCGRILCDLGASVTRVAGELDLDVDPRVRGAAEASLNRGKQTLDADDGGVLAALVRSADVVVFDDRAEPPPGGWRSEAIVVRITASRPDVRGCEKPGSDFTACAESALSWAIGRPGLPPLTLPFDLPGYEAGANAAAACALGVLLRRVRGRGVELAVGTAEVLAYYTGMIASNFIPYERGWQREGTRNAGSGGFYPSAIFRARDGYIALMCRVEREWRALLRAMGDPAWAQEERFRDPRVIARLHADEADRHLAGWVARHTRAELLRAGRDGDFPVAPLRTVTEAIAEEQLEARAFLVELEDAGRRYLAPGSPFRVVEPAGGGIARARRDGFLAPARGRAGPPLSGLRVLDLSWVWSGPMVGSILADLGADVIKVEHRSRPDPARVRGPAIRDGTPVEAPEHEASPYFAQMNHGKRSVAVDIQHPDGAELVRRLADESDVLVENMRPGALSRRGLDYDALSARNPALVFVSLSMAGQTGPLSDLKGYAPVMSGMAGLERLVGYGQDDIVGMLTTAFGDPNAAVHAVAAVFASLAKRARTGLGGWIDLSQIEALLAVLHGPIAHASLLRSEPAPPANRHSLHAPQGHYPCAGDDRWVALSVRSDAEWAALCGVAENAPFVAREELAHAAGRVERAAQLDELIAAWTRGFDRDALVRRLSEAGIVAAPVRSFEDLLAAPKLRDGGAVHPVADPYIGAQPIFTVPWRIDGRGSAAARRAPFMGEHTDAILADLLGLDDAAIERLRAAGAID